MLAIIWCLYFALIAYNVADIIQTAMLLSLGATEANPIMFFIMGHLGDLPGLIVTKSALLFILGFGLILKTREWKSKQYRIS